MGLLSNPLRTRRGRPSRLPFYEKVQKERLSDDEEAYYASSDDSDVYSDESLPSTGSSRQSASSHTSDALMLPRKTVGPQRPGRLQFYRLPNKIVRYMCLGLVLFIGIMIMSLVRASQNENQRLAEGKVAKKPDPPPLWEQFDFLTRYYGGIRTLTPVSKNKPQYPGSLDELPLDALDVNVTDTQTSEDGIDDAASKRGLPESKLFVNHPGSIFTTKPEHVHECFLDTDNKVRVPALRYYEGRPQGFPDNVLGSYELLGLPDDICYERYGRYGPYGFGYSLRAGGLGVGEHGELEGSSSVWEDSKVDYTKVNWADAQRRCYQSNEARYKSLPARTPSSLGFYIGDGLSSSSLAARDAEAAAPSDTKLNATTTAPAKTNVATDKVDHAAEPDKRSRTAIVIRAWDEYLFREDDIMNIRSIISELSLASGGRYDIHLLVQVKNDGAHPIWADHEAYEQRIKDSIPEEFRGLVTLWTETQMLSIYQGMHDLFSRGPDLPVHGVYRGLTMALQYFAYNHPEYDYYWSWEMDIRYTGHHYDLLSKVENWAREQPRKGLWERNSRFYIPSIHGSWEDFRQMSRVQTEMGTTNADNVWHDIPGAKSNDKSATTGEKPIWGPERPTDEDDWFETENDPKPPTGSEKEKSAWGIGEEADLIALNPIFDPEGTTWGLAEDITGYNKNNRSEPLPPRRAHIVTASRLSRRLLMTMHRETAHKKHFAFPEMWPATAAFHHGYKAVFAPHPQFVDREWPIEYFGAVLNAGKNGASGGSRMSVFGQREHNMRGLTWFYNSGFGPNLYRRWLGLKVNNDGGEEFELVEDATKDGKTVGHLRGGEGRMCLPPMLIHPVKDVELPVEGKKDPEEEKKQAAEKEAEDKLKQKEEEEQEGGNGGKEVPQSGPGS
ncbi:hypothetical protein D7B24_002683 [Verticillium nonalfalfae]|uniref:Uncharacterized protein n=1 Tax=Verticillium nonalfalfae TaxID=1051616 RepID=A0A3M9YGJ7_9PEZI|nr:uncharacterized protein D7B24_002683 [Verticillium nonalfalfae]RNJ59305.1 hypothetical protein D7B24_002683 [Verticillium nonalfalfae]